MTAGGFGNSNGLGCTPVVCHPPFAMKCRVGVLPSVEPSGGETVANDTNLTLEEGLLGFSVGASPTKSLSAKVGEKPGGRGGHHGGPCDNDKNAGGITLNEGCPGIIIEED
jgi:hypothetical protein